MLTAETLNEIAVFAPYEGATLEGKQAKTYDVYINGHREDQLEWAFSVSCDTAAMAWACQNYVRRTYSGRVRTQVRIRKSTIH